MRTIFSYYDALEGIPTGEKETSRFSSLEEVFDTVSDDDYYDNLDEYLNNMPRNRESALEIIATSKSWDEWNLYCVLFQDFAEFLTQQELRDMVSRYKEIFDLPFSSIVDEEDLFLE